MSEDKSKSLGQKAIVAGAAIGSAAIAAALLYASKRKAKADNANNSQAPAPSGEQPETD